MVLQITESNSCLVCSEKKPVFNKFLAFQLSFPLLGGFLFGYNTGVISGALLFLKNDFSLSPIKQELVVTVTIAAAAVSSIIAGILAERIGRKPTIILSSIFMMFGSLIMGLAIDINVVILGRAVVGIGIGLASTACPIYIAEVAPESIRGRMIVLFQIMIAGGQFLAALMNALFCSLQTSIWRYMLGVATFPSFIQAFGLVFIPESHRWLLSKDKIALAKKVIRKEGRVPDSLIDDYIDEILIANEGMQKSLKGKNLKTDNIICQIFRNSKARHFLFIGCGISMIQQIVGINGVIYYSFSIINNSGIVERQQVLWCTVLVMLFCFAPLFIAFLLIDIKGRRKLSLWSLFGLIIGSVILALGFQIIYVKSVQITDNMSVLNDSLDGACLHKENCEQCVTIHSCGFCSLSNSTESYCLAVDANHPNYSLDGKCSLENHNANTNFKVGYCSHTYAWVVLLGMSVYLLAFSVGMGPVPWVITSEIYPLWCRGICMAISSTINWTFNILISMTFLSLTEIISRFGAFWLFAGIAVCSFGLIYRWLPEPNQMTLEEVTNIL